MNSIHLVLIAFAIVCEVLASFSVSGRVNLVAAGLAFYFLAVLF